MRKILFFVLLYFFPFGLAAQEIINPNGWRIDSQGRLIAVAPALAASPQVIRTGVLIDAQGRVVLSPSSGGLSAVSAVFGRTGAVAAQANDYNFNQLAGSLDLATQVTGILGDTHLGAYPRM